jgi:hypothetical protein
MKLARLLVVPAAALAFGGLAVGTASATTSQDCQSQLATLRSDTVAAQTSFTNQKSFDDEIAKLDEAATKLTEDKNADAVQKLGDFQSTLNLLATAVKPKVDPTTAQTLTAEAQGVIDCINAIGTTDTAGTTA